MINIIEENESGELVILLLINLNNTKIYFFTILLINQIYKRFSWKPYDHIRFNMPQDDKNVNFTGKVIDTSKSITSQQ